MAKFKVKPKDAAYTCRLLAFVVVGSGAILAPWLWYLGQYLIAADILPQLKPFGFAKYLNRAVLILVIVCSGLF